MKPRYWPTYSGIGQWESSEFRDYREISAFPPLTLTLIPFPLDSLVRLSVCLSPDSYQGPSMLRPSFRHWRHSSAAENLFSFLLEGFIRCRPTCSTAATPGSASLWPQGRKTWRQRRAPAACSWALSLWPRASHLDLLNWVTCSIGILKSLPLRVAVRIKSICITVLNTLHSTGIHYSQRRHCCGLPGRQGPPWKSSLHPLLPLATWPLLSSL